MSGVLNPRKDAAQARHSCCLVSSSRKPRPISIRKNALPSVSGDSSRASAGYPGPHCPAAAASNRLTNAACSGLSTPCCRTLRTVARSPRTRGGRIEPEARKHLALEASVRVRHQSLKLTLAPHEPIDEPVRGYWQTERHPPFVASELTSGSILECGHGAAPVRMAAMRKRLALHRAGSP